MKPPPASYFFQFERQSPAWRYAQSVLLVILASAISFPIHFVVDAVNLVMLYLAVVVIAASFLGRGPSILASVLSVLTFDFFLVEPRLSFSVADTQYILTFLGLLAVSLVLSSTVSQLRSQVQIIHEREKHTAALSALSRALTRAHQLEDILRSVAAHIAESFQRRVVVLLPGKSGLQLAADSSPQNTLNPQELARANKVFQNQQDDLENLAVIQPGQLYYITLRASAGAVGALGIDPSDQALAAPARRDLLFGFANLTALAVERAHLAEQASRAQVLKNTEKLQEALLHSISHELRTPLVSITGTLSALLETPPNTQAPASQEMLETAYEEAQRLNLLLGNLLDISRLESGSLRLSLEPCDLQDLAGIALARFSERRYPNPVQIHIPPGLPLLNLDVTLMAQVLLNLLENAAKYAPEASPIQLSAFQKQEQAFLEVTDQGKGIPPEYLEKIFTKFFRLPRTHPINGLGLGLSISKGIVEAHGGKLNAINRPEGGFTMQIQLPLHP